MEPNIHQPRVKECKTQQNANKRIERRGSQEMIVLVLISRFGNTIHFSKPKKGSKALPYVQVKKIEGGIGELFQDDQSFEDKCTKNGKRDKEIFTALSMECFVEIIERFGVQLKTKLRQTSQNRPKFKKITSFTLDKDYIITNDLIYEIGKEILFEVVQHLRSGSCGIVFDFHTFRGLKVDWGKETALFFQKVEEINTLDSIHCETPNPITENKETRDFVSTQTYEVPFDSVNYFALQYMECKEDDMQIEKESRENE
ncbi:hypothetical protein EIN_221330 [Entamoeba invadens IP1]|uniref:Uncharacterized protein n=1 Tax=Entamoeba invadens IP1 TaxID=370355 RepID=A0A0A1U5D3_ENTIV|nr:hypothetical protein EIN_221330 [Entamoeba invadens IP1]ELP88040.1 hypothetical protein EIN_221330 [Entamoeba invadens IP1]|eukprot:XP_004254811.1 hypothetical protein EIN_221330 [Entamoeba invadens IP1]